MLVVLLIAIDFGRLFFTFIQLNNAAREGAAIAATQWMNNTGITANAMQEVDAQGQYGQHTPTISVTCYKAGTQASELCTNAVNGDQVRVSVNETFTFFTPFVSDFFGKNFSMTASASALIGGTPGVNPTP